MNFWSNSGESKSPSQSESFYFDVETSRGQLFAVLDFAPHDYANLEATLERKLETIVGSFDSVPRFSADLFLGFLTREINNFLCDLEKQSGGTEIFCSGSLCLVSGNRLAYVLCGDTQLNILGNGRSTSMNGNGPVLPQFGVAISEGEQNGKSQRTNLHLDELGLRHWDAPLTGRVPAFTLYNDDVVLVTTGGEESFEQPGLSAMVQDVDSSDAESIGEALMTSSEDFGTVLVIGGPYDQYVDPLLADLSKAVDSLEARVDALTENGQSAAVVPELMEETLEAELEERITPQIEDLKDGLRSKANSIDVLELNEIFKNLSVAVAGKADTSEVLELRRDVLKLSLASTAIEAKETNDTRRKSEEVAGAVPFSGAASVESGVSEEEAANGFGRGVVQIPRQSSFGLRTALVVLAIAIAGAFIGAWLQSRVLRKSPEVWAVKSTSNQIWINRMDQGGQGNVTLNVASPLRARGEQTFSSFADVKQYIDTITVPPVPADQTGQVTEENGPYENKQADSLSSLIAKPEASLKRPSQPENTVSKKSSELTAPAGRKTENKSPKKDAVPTSAAAASLQRDRRVSDSSVASTTPITVGAGDTLNKLAHRYKTTPNQLKKLNPQINEQGMIKSNQKILIPASSPKDAKERR